MFILVPVPKRCPGGVWLIFLSTGYRCGACHGIGDIDLLEQDIQFWPKFENPLIGSFLQTYSTMNAYAAADSYTYGVNDDYSGANFQHTESRDGIVQDVTYDGVPQYGPAVVKTAVVAHPVAHAVAHPDVVAHSVAHVVAHSVTVVHLVAICRQTIIGGWTFYGRRTTMIICRKYSSLFLALHHPVVSFYSCLQTSFKL